MIILLGKRSVVICAIAVAAGICIALLMFQRKVPSGVIELTIGPELVQSEIQTSIRVPESRDPERTNRWWYNQTNQLWMTDISVRSRIDRVLRDPSLEWKNPIAFYGIVIDDTGNPVEGANVSLEWTDGSRDGSTVRRGVTDRSGLFALSGAQGKSLTVRVQKSGYYAGVQSYGVFEYSDPTDINFHQPSASSPIGFEIRRIRSSDSLVFDSGLLDFDGPTVSAGFRLLDGVGWVDVADQPDIVVQVVVGGASTNERKWKVTISAPSGGILRSVGDYRSVAPADGYENEIVFNLEMPSGGNGDWFVERLYVKSRNPSIYSILVLRVKYNYRLKKGNLNVIECYTNPTGSRELE